MIDKKSNLQKLIFKICLFGCTSQSAFLALSIFPSTAKPFPCYGALLLVAWRGRFWLVVVSSATWWVVIASCVWSCLRLACIGVRGCFLVLGFPTWVRFRAIGRDWKTKLSQTTKPNCTPPVRQRPVPHPPRAVGKLISGLGPRRGQAVLGRGWTV